MQVAIKKKSFLQGQMEQLSLLTHSQGLSGIEPVANAFRNSEDFRRLRCDAV
jgi:hypothetical protein